MEAGGEGGASHLSQSRAETVSLARAPKLPRPFEWVAVKASSIPAHSPTFWVFQKVILDFYFVILVPASASASVMNTRAPHLRSSHPVATFYRKRNETEADEGTAQGHTLDSRWEPSLRDPQVTAGGFIHSTDLNLLLLVYSAFPEPRMIETAKT